MKVINFGVGGTGPDHHAMMITQTTDIVRPDIVFCHWSFQERFILFRSDDPCFVIPQLFSKGRLARYLTARESHEARTIASLALASSVLKSRGLPFIWTIEPPYATVKSRSSVPFLDVDFEDIDLGRDGLHPGKRSHKAFAENICDKISANLERFK